MPTKVENIAVKLLKAEDDDVSYAIKADVTHQKGEYDDDTDVIVEIQGIDRDGFEVLNVYLEGNVPFGQTKTLTKRVDYCDKNDFQSAVRWQAAK